MKTKIVLIGMFLLSIISTSLFGQIKNTSGGVVDFEKLKSMVQIQRSNNYFTERQNLNQHVKTSHTIYNGKSPFSELSSRSEIFEMRNAYSRTFDNGDGTFKMISSNSPIHFKNNGNWEEIDTKILSIGGGGFGFSNVKNTFESYFGNYSKSGVKTIVEGSEILDFLNTSMYWEKGGQELNRIQSLSKPATIKENKLYYHEIYGNISAEFQVLTSKRKLNYIIPDDSFISNHPINADYLVFSEDIIFPSNWRVEIKGNQVLFFNENNQLKGRFNAPVVYENYQNEDENQLVRENPTELEIIQNGNRLTYLLKVETDWLFSTDRIFPIAIDPTFTSVVKNEDYMSGFADETGVGFDDEIWIGYWFGDEIDGYVRYDLSAIPAGSTINSATSGLFRFSGSNLNGNRFYRPGSSNFDPRHWVAYILTGLFDDWFYYDLFYSYTGDIGANSTSFSAGSQYKTSAFNGSGLLDIQNGLEDGYVNVLFYPIGNSWVDNNYGRFRGYSVANINQKPYLEINYTAGCSTPSSASNTRYINNVKFLGSLNPDTNNNSNYSTGGYGNYLSLTNRAKQIPGGGINVYVGTTGNPSANFIKAWVDWNQDGIYEPQEELVFDSGNILTTSTTFGFIVPLSTTPGNYTIRIRNYYYNEEYDEFGYYYGPCGSRPNGEAEDYTFEVIADCAAKITNTNIDSSHGFRCGAGAVTLSAQGTGSSFRWYESEFGGAPIPGQNSSIFVTPNLTATRYYWVTSHNGTCESSIRTQVVAQIDPIPIINFNATEPNICGDTGSMLIESSGDQEEITIFSEDFNDGLGLFSVYNIVNNGNTVNNFTQWKIKQSTYIPEGAVWFPAINSGSSIDNFVFATSDIAPGYLVNTELRNNTYYDTFNFLNLTLDFYAYFSHFNPGDPDEGLYVEVSIDGTSWIIVQAFKNNLGIGTRFEKLSVDLTDYIDQPNLRIRFRYQSQWADGVAIDDVRLYGDIPLETNFNWTGPAVIYEEDCVTPYTNASTSVCIKPDILDIENDENWTITASATLSNGCSAIGNISILNNNKFWNSTNDNWFSSNWSPGPSIPTQDQCVIVKKPVTIPTLNDAYAKNIKIESAGSLKIESLSSLTLSDYIHNEGTVEGFIVENNANLLQINPNANNVGAIQVEKQFNFVNGPIPSDDRKQYNFVISPVVGQNIKTIYPGNPTVIQHEEATNFYYYHNGSYTPGKGLSIKEPTKSQVSTSTATAKFKGAPFNGDLSYPLSYTTTNPDVSHGFNLIGNPYPSNIDIEALYDANASIMEPNFYFWDNRGNTLYVQHGSNYNGDNFAKYNAASGTGTGTGQPAEGAPDKTRIPNQYAKVGTAFLIRALPTANGQSIVFSNEFRTNNNSGPGYFGKGENFEGESQNTKDRYWLSLATPTGIEYMNAIVYFDEGNNEFGLEDTETFGASNDIYSLVGNYELAIQGKSNFTTSDIVPIGIRVFQTGVHKISILQSEGVFANGQKIYLKDKFKNKLHDLTTGPYEFKSAAGQFNQRFEIVYKRLNISASSTKSLKNEVEIKKINGFIQVNSSIDKIANLEIFSLTGKSLYKNLKFDSKEIKIPMSLFNNEIVIVNVLTDKGEWYSKKFIIN